MSATQTRTRSKTARKTETTRRPVTETLLELAYMMHVTKVVAMRDESRPLPAAPHAR